MQLVRGPAVTIHAVHSPDLIFRRIVFEIRIAILGDALRVRASDPGNGEELLVGCDILDFVGEVHVPMNPAHGSVRWVTSADVEQEANGERRVLLIRKIMLITALNVADVFLWPVALLADRLRRARIGCGETNRAIE